METPPIGEVAVSVTFCDESSRAIAASWAGAVQVYKADDAGALGNLATNPPALDERLAAAQQRLKEKTESSGPLAEAVTKAEAELVSVQSSLATGQKEAAALQSEIARLGSEKSEVEKLRAASDGERANIATTIGQLQDARPLVAEALRHLTEALGKLPNDVKLIESQRQLTDQLKAMEAQVADSQTRHAELSSAVSAADERLKETSAQLEQVNKALADTDQRVKALESQSQQSTTALESARQAAQAAQAELAQAQSDVARWQDEIAFRDQMAALQTELEAARKLADERQIEVDKANEQLAAAQSVVDSAKATLDEASRGADAVKAKIQAARSPK
jgi:chromosome segregation ATPase